MANRIDGLKSPLLVSWQITRDCDLSCLHCCTESAPGKRLADELTGEEAMKVVDDIVRNEVPYVMLCGGEPLTVPHFFALAEALGVAGVQIKIETNGQQFNDTVAVRLARLPVRSVQVSLDADTQGVYARQRPGASLEKAHAACLAARAAGLPLEVTFAPTRLNLHEAEDVLRRAHALGAFRFNTGKLMRIGTAARLWHKLEPSAEQYEDFRTMLRRQEQIVGGKMEICYAPFTLADGLRASLEEPPATMLVLPNGWVKVAAALPHVCADIRRQTLAQAWRAYCGAWRDESVLCAVRAAINDEARHQRANAWQALTIAHE
jgi:MoaA/NifB/PqqE/SkfB family radical SAM enzyme